MFKLSYTPKFITISFVALTSISTLGCGDDELDTNSAVPAPEEWLGADTHATMVGTVAGYQLNVDLIGEAAVTRVTCKREYEVPDKNDPSTWSNGVLKEFEVNIEYTTPEGLEQIFELGMSRLNFETDVVSQELTIVAPADEDAPSLADDIYLEVEGTWEDGDTFVEFEEMATSGTFEITEFSGNPGEDGLVIPSGEGNFSGYLTATFAPGEAFTISFSAPCEESEVELIED